LFHVMNDKYDVVIIGAGPGGYPCAIRLAQLKKKVLVVEERFLGGLCLNWGCIPTKALSFAAEMVDNFKKAKKIGFKVEASGLDLNQMRDWKDGVVKKLRGGIEYLFKNNGVEWKQGKARIVSEHKVEITKDDNEEFLDTENIVIATGTEVTALPGLNFDSRYIINTDDALELKEIPENLLVIGAGASGLEMATIYKRLGSNIKIVEIMPQILPGMETEICEQLTKILQKTGIEVFLNSQVACYEIKDGRLEVTIKGQDSEIKEIFDKILVTVGRRPFDYAFADLGIETDPKKYIKVDGTLKTNIKNIYAIGDVVGLPLLAHKATKQGIIVAEIISGLKTYVESHKIPSCVFTIPPFSSVGLTEKEAIENGYKVKIGRFPYRASGKALSMEEMEGMVKIVGDEDGRLLGMHILGAESSNLIGEGILGIDKKISVDDLAEIIHPHPTLTEIIGEAAENFYKKAINIINT